MCRNLDLQKTKAPTISNLIAGLVSAGGFLKHTDFGSFLPLPYLVCFAVPFKHPVLSELHYCSNLRTCKIFSSVPSIPIPYAGCDYCNRFKIRGLVCVKVLLRVYCTKDYESCNKHKQPANIDKNPSY